MPAPYETCSHNESELARTKQIDLMSRPVPPVKLPIHQKGCFMAVLTDPPLGSPHLSRLSPNERTKAPNLEQAVQPPHRSEAAHVKKTHPPSRNTAWDKAGSRSHNLRRLFT